MFTEVFVSEFPVLFINKTDAFTTIREPNLFELFPLGPLKPNS